MIAAASLARYRAALRFPDVRRLLSAFTILEIGAWSYTVVLAAWIFTETGSVTGIAAVGLVRWVTGMLVTSFAGVLVDRFERRRLLVTCSLLMVVSMSCMTVAVAMSAPIWLIMLISAINATIDSPVRSAGGALLPEVVDESDLVPANVLFNLAGNLVLIAGPLLGGLLILVASPAVAVAMNACTYGLAGLIFARLSVRRQASPDSDEEALGPLAQWRGGLQALAARPTVMAIVVCIMASTALDSAYTVVFAQLTEELSLGESGYSLFFASSALGGVAFALVANQFAERSRLGVLIGGALVTQGLLLGSVGLSNSVPVVLLALMLAGGATVMIDVLAMTAIQRALPNHLMGRTLSSVIALSLLSASLAIVTLGWSIEHRGLDQTTVTAGVIVAAIGALVLPLLARGEAHSHDVATGLQPVADVLAQLDLFDGLDRAGIEALALAAEPVSLPAGHVLLRQGDPADDLWVLTAGTLSIAIDGTETSVPPVTAPGWVGELGVINRHPRSATVTLAEASDLLRIDGRQFLQAISVATPSPSLLRTMADRTYRSTVGTTVQHAPVGAMALAE